jgi:hypothetical protein
VNPEEVPSNAFGTRREGIRIQAREIRILGNVFRRAVEREGSKRFLAVAQSITKVPSLPVLCFPHSINEDYQEGLESS